jgi:hypothetical protein
VVAGYLACALIGPVSALAQSHSCQAAPQNYSGTDDVVRELRALRHDERDQCLALADRLDAIEESAQPLDGRLSGIRSELDGVLDVRLERGSDAETPLYTDGTESGESTVALSGYDRDLVEDVQGSLHADLYLLAGLLAAAFAGFLIARQVFPR